MGVALKRQKTKKKFTVLGPISVLLSLILWTVAQESECQTFFFFLTLLPVQVREPLLPPAALAF